MKQLIVIGLCLLTVFVFVGALLIAGREIIEMVLPAGGVVGDG